MKKELKEKWKQYLAKHSKWCKKFNNHHYFRSRCVSKFWLKEIEDIIKKEKGIWAYHGTNKENALKIMENGFQAGTHFAHHLEECLEFGGSWVFRIKWEDKPANWQFLNEKHIPPERIDRLTQFRPIVRIGTQAHLTRKVDSKTESNNLKGKSLI